MTITEIECVAMEICKTDGNMVVVNLYNPYRALCPEILDSIIKKQGNRREIWCGDFNAHKNSREVNILMAVEELTNPIAPSAEWSIKRHSSIGSDHFPIICAFDVELDI